MDLNQAQAGFIRFAALDLFNLLARVEPAVKVLVKALQDNVTLYQSLPDKGPGGAASPVARAAKS